MSGSHKEFPKKAVFVQLGLAALVGIGFLAADKPAVHAMGEKVVKPIVAAAAKVLAPIGKVEVKEESMASAARSGEEIYGATCGVCHDNGVAGAPKLDDTASWETRLSGGYAALVTSAINGKGGMPARGGNPDITDSEMELVVSHMIKKAGIDLVPRSSATTPATAVEEKSAMAVKAEAAPKKEEKVVVETKVEEKIEAVKTEAAVAAATETVDHSAGEAVYKNSCFACHDSGVAGSPKIGDKAGWSARIAMGPDSLHEAAIKGKGAMPAKGGNMSISDGDIKAAVDYMVSESM
ncbi:MAG: cytochrome c5 [Cocleimonas sp.]|jgi:cytochrome c5